MEQSINNKIKDKEKEDKIMENNKEQLWQALFFAETKSGIENFPIYTFWEKEELDKQINVKTTFKKYFLNLDKKAQFVLKSVAFGFLENVYEVNVKDIKLKELYSLITDSMFIKDSFKVKNAIYSWVESELEVNNYEVVSIKREGDNLVILSEHKL